MLKLRARDGATFTREDAKRRDVLQESIARDQALRDQTSRWNDLDRLQRETLVRNLVDKTVTAYGMDDDPPRVRFKPLKETGIGAKYDPTTDAIIINTASPEYRHGKSLGGSIAGTAVHEAEQYEILHDQGGPVTGPELEHPRRATDGTRT